MSDTNHLPWPVTPPNSNSKPMPRNCSWTWSEWSRLFQSKHSTSTCSIGSSGAVAIIITLLETLFQGIRSQLQEVRTRTLNFIISNFQFKNGLAVLFLHLHWLITLNQLINSMAIHDFTLNLRFRVLRVSGKINHLKLKINEINHHQHVPG